MTVQSVSDLQMPIGQVLKLAGSEGVLLKPQGQLPFALIPLSDELIDFLLERNPRLIDDCREIRQRMASGATHTQEEVNAMFGRTGAS
ncbi:MAG TPA: hypothetical protein VJ783_22975 [Pirellulales bacterium]|nr:hypothetical protein [Pirellulales bacterium]